MKRPTGGDTFARILAVVRRVPRGRVASYGQIARLAGLPRHARHVGYALHGLPAGSSLPWHRVLNARGAISLRSWDAMTTQRLRLEQEGVTFGARGRVSLREFGWEPVARRKRAGASAAASRPTAKRRRTTLNDARRRLDPSGRLG